MFNVFMFNLSILSGFVKNVGVNCNAFVFRPTSYQPSHVSCLSPSQILPNDSRPKLKEKHTHTPVEPKTKTKPRNEMLKQKALHLKTKPLHLQSQTQTHTHRAKTQESH